LVIRALQMKAAVTCPAGSYVIFKTAFAWRPGQYLGWKHFRSMQLAKAA
jgi:hypothetical protein